MQDHLPMQNNLHVFHGSCGLGFYFPSVNNRPRVVIFIMLFSPCSFLPSTSPSSTNPLESSAPLMW